MTTSAIRQGGEMSNQAEANNDPVQGKTEVEDGDYREHAFAHAMHEESIFYNRLNFFLVFESVLLGALVTSFGDNEKPPYLLLAMICVFGFGTSMVWLAVQFDKLVLIETQWLWLDRLYPAFKRLTDEAGLRKSVRATKLLAIAVPAAFIVMWLVATILVVVTESRSL